MGSLIELWLIKIEKEMTYIGHYIDRLILKDSLWKIAHRTAVMDWNPYRRGEAIQYMQFC